MNSINQLEKLLGRGVDSFDTPTELRPQAGNPAFTAQFDLSLQAKYYTLNSGAYTNIAAAALNAALKNDLTFFLFGQSDFDSGYAKLKAQNPVNSNWSYGIPFIYGKDAATGGLTLDATVTGDLENGDLVIPYTSALPGSGTTTLALLIVRCNSVAYASLLGATSSDTFVVDGIRYTLDDPTTNAGQYAKAISVYNLSLFGKFDSDSFVPNAFKQPDQFQNGIVDLPIQKGISKHNSIAFKNLYTNVSQSMSIFVKVFNKVSA